MNIGGYELQVPFVTTSTDHIKTILEFAEVKEGVKVVDLGSGDGRMILEFAKKGAICVGYEHKEHLVEKTKQRIKDAGLEEKAFVYQEDFWQIDLATFDVIYIYGMRSIFRRLEEKIKTEARSGTKIISSLLKIERIP